MDNARYALERLPEILVELEKIAFLPASGTEEAKAIPHDEWMARSKKLDDLHDRARGVALTSIPDEVAIILHQFYSAWEGKHGCFGKKEEHAE